MSFFIYLAIKWVILFIQHLFPFLLTTFSIVNCFWFVFCNSFFQKASIVSSPTNGKICPRHMIFKFLIHKNFSRPIWSVIINFKFRVVIINFFTWVIICVWFYIDRFHLNCSNWTIYSNLSIYTFFWNWGHAFINFIFKALVDLSTMTDFLHYALNTFLYHYSVKAISSIFCKIHCFIYPYFIWFANWFIWNFWKALAIVISFLCFKGTTYAYLL